MTKISIYGAVQGVGFRPFIYKVAHALNLKGEVYNDSEGVKIILDDSHLNGDIDKFLNVLKKDLPSLARVDKIIIKEIKNSTNVKSYDKFSISKSKEGSKFSPILPDFALCKECKDEFYDPKNRRYMYPFMSCTNCGPRLSIIKSLPYDRANTTMNEFDLCDKCYDEYTNQGDRRFHAEPISCFKCGPNLVLKSADSKVLAKSNDTLKLASKLLKSGKILAIKGLGGFHLVCDALNSEAISKLRKRKHRPTKPFALMCKDSAMASIYAKISKSEKDLLESKVAPIVLLESKDKLPINLAPNLGKVGIFLAPTSLHLLLFEYINSPLIATSANLSGEPIICNEDTLVKKLKGVFDYYLDNDREIITPSDDSLSFIVDEKPLYLRTSRGIMPKIEFSKFTQKGVFLALGAEMKSQFVIYKDGLIISSPYIGDLKNVANFERFLAVLDIFVKAYDLKFDAIIGDLHPDFIHTKYFENLGYKVDKVQHHYAHLLSNLYENKLIGGEFLGFSFDGTGYGRDAKIWGGEVMRFNTSGFERIYHFDEFLLLGGDRSIKDISRLAYAIFKKYSLDISALNLSFDSLLDQMYDKKINSFYTTSLGRIFDAFCVVVLGLKTVTYEAEAGSMIEKFYDSNIKQSYKFTFQNGIIEYKDAFLGALSDDKFSACTKFINGLADLVLNIALKERLDVVLSGGVFQNQALANAISKKLKNSDIPYYFNREIPTNDSGVAMGQLVWYLSNLATINKGLK
ncbi:MAG: carbamoyltransferase HypF [Campylobacter sp.]|nr:carbamoyltransferase HypF [Campylobacter sp.]